jgi:hypothetical protein
MSDHPPFSLEECNEYVAWLKARLAENDKTRQSLEWLNVEEKMAAHPEMQALVREQTELSLKATGILPNEEEEAPAAPKKVKHYHGFV